MRSESFAVWITGLPGSGKSTIAKSLRDRLESLGIEITIIESDELRRTLAPNLGYGDAELDNFYRQMVFLGRMMAKHGIPVIFDATANRRVWRDEARRAIPHFVEVYVDAPLELCMSRNPKCVPDVQSAYEAPVDPEVVVDWAESPVASANRIVSALIDGDYLMPLPMDGATLQEDSALRHQ